LAEAEQLIQDGTGNNNGKIELIMKKLDGIKNCLNSQFLERKEAVDIIISAII
jgi:hypothetical protein